MSRHIRSCTRCGRTTVSQHRWRELSPAARRRLGSMGVGQYVGRNLCSRCWGHAREHGTLEDHERTTRRGEWVVEDWLELRAEGYTRRNAAARLGMNANSFDRVLTRAVRRGLLDAELALPLERSPHSTTALADRSAA